MVDAAADRTARAKSRYCSPFLRRAVWETADSSELSSCCRPRQKLDEFGAQRPSGAADFTPGVSHALGDAFGIVAAESIDDAFDAHCRTRIPHSDDALPQDRELR